MINQILPDKCQSCFKSNVNTILNECPACSNTSLSESVLCDLNRNVQSRESEFICHAFQPMIKLLSSDKNLGPKPVARDEDQDKISLSEKHKYNMALYLQKVSRDQDYIFSVLKYHIVWNTYHRKKLFPDSVDLIKPFLEIFKDLIIKPETMVLPLWIALDHVHVYVETNGNTSIDEIIQKIKKSTEKKLAFLLSNMSERQSDAPIWDDAYFVETIDTFPS